MTVKELLRMNTPKLREEALKIPNAVGVTAMKKEDLIVLLAEANGIVLEKKTSGTEKVEIKEHIAAMKVKRDDAIARQAYEELKQIRRGIRTLKRRIRALAKAAKRQPLEVSQQAPQVPAPGAEAAPEATKATSAEAPADN